MSSFQDLDETEEFRAVGVELQCLSQFMKTCSNKTTNQILKNSGNRFLTYTQRSDCNIKMMRPRNN